MRDRAARPVTASLPVLIPGPGWACRVPGNHETAACGDGSRGLSEHHWGTIVTMAASIIGGSRLRLRLPPSVARLWLRASEGRRKRRIEADQASVEAAAMILRHGDLAYWIARRWARDERLTGRRDPFRPVGHWERVRRDIGRMIGHEVVDRPMRTMSR